MSGEDTTVTAMSLQTAGAVLILACYAVDLYSRDQQQQSKLLLLNNFLGSTVIAITSIEPRQWGSVLLEGAWAALAAAFLLRALLTMARSTHLEPVRRRVAPAPVSPGQEGGRHRMTRDTRRRPTHRDGRGRQAGRHAVTGPTEIRPQTHATAADELVAAATYH
ncbi:hypothetical protein GCM10029964_093200 [Kibdelosporangium lantanae]